MGEPSAELFSPADGARTAILRAANVLDDLVVLIATLPAGRPIQALQDQILTVFIRQARLAVNEAMQGMQISDDESMGAPDALPLVAASLWDYIWNGLWAPGSAIPRDALTNEAVRDGWRRRTATARMRFLVEMRLAVLADDLWRDDLKSSPLVDVELDLIFRSLEVASAITTPSFTYDEGLSVLHQTIRCSCEEDGEKDVRLGKEHLREHVMAGQEVQDPDERPNVQFRVYFGLLYHAIGQSPEQASCGRRNWMTTAG